MVTIFLFFCRLEMSEHDFPKAVANKRSIDSDEEDVSKKQSKRPKIFDMAEKENIVEEDSETCCIPKSPLVKAEKFCDELDDDVFTVPDPNFSIPTFCNFLMIQTLTELQQRSQINNTLIQEAYSAMEACGSQFLKLPDICVGEFQVDRFHHDKCETTDEIILFYTQFARSQADTYYQTLMKVHEKITPLYLYGNIGTGKSYVLYQTACKLFLERDRFRVAYVNLATPSRLVDDYILSLASTLYDEKIDGPALEIIKKLFGEDGLLRDDATFEEKQNVLIECYMVNIVTLESIL